MRCFSKKVIYDNIKFDSVLEKDFYKSIKQDKNITDIILQPQYILINSFKDNKGKTERACVYTADFKFIKENKEYIVEIKSIWSAKMPDYILRRKFFKYKYPELNFIELIEKSRKSTRLVDCKGVKVYENDILQNKYDTEEDYKNGSERVIVRFDIKKNDFYCEFYSIDGGEGISCECQNIRDLIKESDNKEIYANFVVIGRMVDNWEIIYK